MAPPKRRVSTPTHPTVWVGLALASVGLLVALYAYTGDRIYDVAFFFVALAGGFLALTGILVAAWGRAIGSARMRSPRKAQGAAKDDAKQPEVEKPTPPTVAAPRSKRAFAFQWPKRKAPADGAPPKPVFAFRRSSPADATATMTAATALGERLQLECPQCQTQFTAEGVRPIATQCPECGLKGEV